MAEKKYYWLKLQEDYFRTKEIKKLRRIAGGDTFVIIYLKMQLLSLKNEGVLIFEGVEDDLASELALELDEQEDNIKMTLAFLQNNGMIEQTSDYEYFLNRVPEMTTSETDAAKRMRISRQKRNNVTEKRNNVTNSYNQLQHIEIEKEIDIDLDKEIEKDIKIKYNPLLENPKADTFDSSQNDSSQKKEPSKYENIITLYNIICTELSHFIKLTDKRKTAINKLLKEYTLEEIEKGFKLFNESDFCKGINDRGWKADFDFCIKPDKMASVLEGKYNNVTKKVFTNENPKSNKFHNFMQHEEIDLEEIGRQKFEKKLNELRGK